MFGLIYSKNGKIETHKQEFENRQEAEKLAKDMGVDKFEVFPTFSKKIDFSKGIVDFGVHMKDGKNS